MFFFCIFGSKFKFLYCVMKNLCFLFLMLIVASGVFAQTPQGQKVTKTMKGSELSQYIRENELEGKTVTITYTIVPNGKHNGHEYVNLGLSVKWATCNVGATTAEGYGDYYAWGETDTKRTYDFDTYKWCKGDWNAITKYCTDSEYGTVDNKKTLSTTDDVAHVKWGGNWRMPTRAELDELRTKCEWTWTTKNGVRGYRVTGPNGNTIFLPAAGYRLRSVELYGAGETGCYWSSSLYESNQNVAISLTVYSHGVRCDGSTNIRYNGESVRPVCP